MPGLTLEQLFGSTPGVLLTPELRALTVSDVCDDSRSVTRGAVFVAVPGTHRDGRTFIADAVARGAAAVVTESDAAAAVPVIRVPDARAVLARLAAALHGDPASAMTLVGITGTIGKTSVLTMLSHVLECADIANGTIGSLGATYRGRTVDTGNTTPGILTTQRALAGMVRGGGGVAAMEVTSHALLQQRVAGLCYDLGIFTNLRMLEHMEYHDSFDEYADAKLRFLDHLKSSAPLIYSAGDRAVKHAARLHEGPRISCGGGSAWVNVRRDTIDLRGARITLRLRRALPLIAGGCLDAIDLPLELRMIGRANTGNAALAAVAGLMLGAPPAAVQQAFRTLEPPRRRLEVLRDHDPIIIDDTVGHPDSISAVFELVERAPHARVRVVMCVRGMRGEEINRNQAEAIAVWSRRVPLDALHITSAADTADERNRTSDAELDALRSVLRERGVAFTHHERLRDALDEAGAGLSGRDVLLLLGAQGMDAAADLIRRSGSPAKSRRH